MDQDHDVAGKAASAESTSGKSARGELVSKVTGSITGFVKDRAEKAITKLVGAYWPQVLTMAQDAEDERYARTKIRNAIADAAAAKAVQDPALVDRTLQRLATDALGAQINREAVVEKALEHLAETTSEGASAESAAIDDDWMNVFGSYAEKATSGSLRDMWGRVLAGEIRKPGAFSLPTLQFVSVLDKQTASAVQRAFEWLIDDDCLLASFIKSVPVDEVRLLLDANLISTVTSPDLTTIISIDFGGGLLRLANKRAMIVRTDGPGDRPVTVRTTALSRVGRELIPLMSLKRNEDLITHLVEAITPFGQVESILVGDYDEVGNGQIKTRILKSVWKRV